MKYSAIRHYTTCSQSHAFAQAQCASLLFVMLASVYAWYMHHGQLCLPQVLSGCFELYWRNHQVGQCYNLPTHPSPTSPSHLLPAGSDRKIKEFEEAPGSGTQITKEIDAGVNLTQISLLHGAKVRSVTIIQWPTWICRSRERIRTNHQRRRLC